jgi:membrane protein YdbS with pleckstrin-like domain
MPRQTSPTTNSSRDRQRVRRLRVVLLFGIVLILLATPAMVVIALMSEAAWAFIAALATFAVGLLAIVSVIAPGRSSFHGGTKIWQNDGLPGGF